VIGVLTGFSIIGSVIALGYVIQRTGLIGDNALLPLSRLIYFFASPALLFTVMVSADVGVLFSRGVLVTAMTMAICVAAFVAASRLLFRMPAPDTVIGILTSVQANAGNIGLPVSVYVLGDAQYVAPVMLLQNLVLTPVCLIILDLSTQATIDLRTVVLQPVRNPAIIASLSGLVIAVSGVHVPDVLLQPVELVGDACVPLFLLTFGMALHGQRFLAPGSGRRQVATVTAVKVLVMPVAAFVLGRYVFGLPDAVLFPVVVVAALPTAQNVYNFAVRFGKGESMTISAVMLTTLLSVPILVLIAGVLHP